MLKIMGLLFTLISSSAFANIEFDCEITKRRSNRVVVTLDALFSENSQVYGQAYVFLSGDIKGDKITNVERRNLRGSFYKDEKRNILKTRWINAPENSTCKVIFVGTQRIL